MRKRIGKKRTIAIVLSALMTINMTCAVSATEAEDVTKTEDVTEAEEVTKAEDVEIIEEQHAVLNDDETEDEMVQVTYVVGEYASECDPTKYSVQDGKITMSYQNGNYLDLPYDWDMVLNSSNWKLEGWYLDPDFNERANINSVNEDLTLYGKFVPAVHITMDMRAYIKELRECTIEDHNGIEIEKKEAGEVFNNFGLYNPLNPLGLMVEGWYFDKEYTRKCEEGYVFTEDITLYPRFATSITLTWNTNSNGEERSVLWEGDDSWSWEGEWSEKAAADFEISYKMTPDPNYKEWNLVGWALDPDGKNMIINFETGENKHYCPTGDVTLYAIWEKPTEIDIPVLTSVSNTTTGVKVSWEAVDGAANYRVYRKTAGKNWTAVGDTTSVTFTDKSSQSGKKYTYTVCCISSDGSRELSKYNETGKTITYIAAPKISEVKNTTTGVKVSWGKVSGAAKYRVLRKTAGGSWKIVGETTSDAYTDKTAKSGTKYTYAVRCMDSAGKKYTSSYYTSGKTITYIAAPKISKVTNTTTGVKVSWSKVSGAAKYRVLRKTAGGSWKKMTDTTSVSYVDKTAKKGKTYYYTVRCIDSTGKKYTSAYNTTGTKIVRK